MLANTPKIRSASSLTQVASTLEKNLQSLSRSLHASHPCAVAVHLASRTLGSLENNWYIEMHSPKPDASFCPPQWLRCLGRPVLPGFASVFHLLCKRFLMACFLLLFVLQILQVCIVTNQFKFEEII